MTHPGEALTTTKSTMPPKKSTKRNDRESTSGKAGRQKALTAAQSADLIVRWLAGESQPVLAREFGIGTSTVRRVLAASGFTAAHRKALKTAQGDAPGESSRPEYVAEYNDLGEPPVDAIGIAQYMTRAIARSTRQLLTDTTISESARRKELRDNIKAAAALKKEAEIADVLDMMEAEQDETDRDKSGPTEKDAAKVTRATRRGTPKRV